jgi:hypothetical protein
VAALLQADPGAALAWSDDCGGAFAPLDLSAWPAAASTAWTAPPAGPVACTLVPALSSGGLADAFPVAVLVADPPP